MGEHGSGDRRPSQGAPVEGYRASSRRTSIRRPATRDSLTAAGTTLRVVAPFPGMMPS